MTFNFDIARLDQWSPALRERDAVDEEVILVEMRLEMSRRSRFQTRASSVAGFSVRNQNACLLDLRSSSGQRNWMTSLAGRVCPRENVVLSKPSARFEISFRKPGADA